DASPRTATPKGHSLHHLHSTASRRTTYTTSPSQRSWRKQDQLGNARNQACFLRSMGGGQGTSGSSRQQLGAKLGAQSSASSIDSTSAPRTSEWSRGDGRADCPRHAITVLLSGAVVGGVPSSVRRVG